MKKLLISAVLFVFCLGGIAEAGSGLYVKGNVGIFLPNDFDIEVEGIEVGELGVDTGIGFSGAVGHSFSKHLDIEGEFAYRTADDEFDDTNSVKTLMVNAIFNLDSSLKINPYAGAGLGIAWLEDGGEPEFSATAFAYQLMAGVETGFTEQISGLIGYRFVGTGDAQDDLSGYEFSTSLSSHNIDFGLKYSF